MITILKGHRGNIDFRAPIEMTLEQKRKFIEFMKNLFETVEEEKVEEFRLKRVGEKNFMKGWTVDEYMLLISPDKTNEEVSKRLGRSWMSIEMKRVFYIDEITKKANEKGINLYKANKETIKKLVEEYIKENEVEILKRRKKRHEENRKVKAEKEELKRLKEEIPKDEKLVGVSGFITKEKLDEKKRRFEELKSKLKE